jgi:cell division protein FtsL
MLLQKLSQILAVAGISASQEEKILTTVKNIPELQEVIDNQKFHEPHLESPLIILANLQRILDNHGLHPMENRQ